MRIAFVVDSFPRLSETFILNQVTGLLDLGCDVRIVAARKSPETLVHPAFRAYGLADRISHDYRPLLDEPFDVVHAHFGPNGHRCAILRKVGMRGALVTSFHGYDVRGAGRGAIYRDLWAAGDLFLAVSEYSRTRLLDLGAPREKLVVHPNGVNVGTFSPLRRVARGPLRLLTVARLVPEKGIEIAIRAIAGLPDVEYRVVGDGPLLDELRRLARRLGAAVTFTGAGDALAVARELARADIFLLPSLAEASPVVIREAQAAGRPVIATLVGGVSEMIRHGETGLLVGARRPRALARAIAKLGADAELRDTIALRARGEVPDIGPLNRRLIDLYRLATYGDPTKLYRNRRPVV